jgi:hypothetical protein
MSNFSFLQAEWPSLHDAATNVESFANPDARTDCFHARCGLEVPVAQFEWHREFAARVTAVEALKTAQRASLAELDAPFAPLQHRGFRRQV